MNGVIEKENKLLTPEEKNWAISCHLSALLGHFIPFGNVLGPLVIWIIKKEESSFIDKHGKAAFNFQLSILLYSIVSGILVCLIIGLIFLLAIAIFNFVMIIISTNNASKGSNPDYPLSIRFIK